MWGTINLKQLYRDKECYIFNVWNYNLFIGKSRPWSHPINDVDEGTYKVEVNVTGSKHTLFMLRNVGTKVDDFKLDVEPVIVAQQDGP